MSDGSTSIAKPASCRSWRRRGEALARIRRLWPNIDRPSRLQIFLVDGLTRIPRGVVIRVEPCGLLEIGLRLVVVPLGTPGVASDKVEARFHRADSDGLREVEDRLIHV